jgi:putative acetyltransferase
MTSKFSDQIILRIATPADLPEMQNLFSETVRTICIEDYSPEQIRLWASGSENKPRWEDKLKNQYSVVAEFEKKIVGFASLEHNYIDFLYVHKDFQRRGIAQVLFNNLRSKAEQKGEKRLTSHVSKTAKSFFEKNGFRVLAENIVRLKGVELINYEMELLL